MKNCSFFCTLSFFLLFGCSVDQNNDDKLQNIFSVERPIDARHSFWIDELTWMEVRDFVGEKYITAIIPTGGIEQNGPFLTTGKHNVILEATCPMIAKKLGNALCAPIIKFVPEGNIEPPSGMMFFPGTISLRSETYEALLDDIGSSLRQSGFENIVYIGDSGGNQKGMSSVVSRLNQRWKGERARAYFIGEYYNPGWEETEQFTKNTLGISETQEDGYHDDIWVTAMMMVIDPNQVRYQERLKANLASINGVSIKSVDQIVELGNRMIEFRSEYTVNAIKKAIIKNDL
jgi:creatinine amidohydrolase/Fe(II)-dependent formamide hydrolase-like protein